MSKTGFKLQLLMKKRKLTFSVLPCLLKWESLTFVLVIGARNLVTSYNRHYRRHFVWSKRRKHSDYEFHLAASVSRSCICACWFIVPQKVWYYGSLSHFTWIGSLLIVDTCAIPTMTSKCVLLVCHYLCCCLPPFPRTKNCQSLISTTAT